MSNNTENAQNSPNLMQSISQELEKVEAAVGNLATAAEIQLAGINLEANELSEERKAEVLAVMARFLSVAGLALLPAKDSERILGGEIKLNGRKFEFIRAEGTSQLESQKPTKTRSSSKAAPTKASTARTPAKSSPRKSLPAAAASKNTSKATGRTASKSVPATSATKAKKSTAAKPASKAKPTSAPKPAPKREQAPAPGAEVLSSGVNLYDKIIPGKLFGKLDREGKTPTSRLFIISDNTIKINDQEIVLDKDELYIFNALMILRDRPARSGEIRAFGFRPGTSAEAQKSALAPKLAALAEKVNKAAGKEIFSSAGVRAGVRYASDPGLQVVEQRTGEEPVKKN